jgi:peptidoglycan/xylan/chitin deacetylase (PgdA/CDA1 family)
LVICYRPDLATIRTSRARFGSFRSRLLMNAWRVPVLTYHAGNVASADYAGNDHVAIASDLAMFTHLGWRVVPLSWVVEELLGLATRDLRRCVALTCDDGTVLDAEDVDYPGQGLQRGFLSCLRDAVGQADRHLTSFVIADPAARARMDVQCLQGLDWMGEGWWRDALQSGLMAIECHSWDHNHEVLDADAPDGMVRGDFFQVDNATRARFEIDQAVAYLNARLYPSRCRFFAYPYGHASDYLRVSYLPAHGTALGLQAAFGVQGEPVTGDSEVWHLPRYVCGWHWKSPDELAAILAACG